MYNGLDIGKVKSIRLDEGTRIILSAELNKDFILPKNPGFIIITTDLLGSRAMEIRNLPDTLEEKSVSRFYGTYEEVSLIESLRNMTIEFIESSVIDSNQDSLLIEIRKLNQNIEDLKK